MPFPNAAQRRLKQLYHWQRFDAGRLEAILRDNAIYCSRPSDFNDPCKMAGVRSRFARYVFLTMWLLLLWPIPSAENET